jgi:hypothetical protein
MPTHSSCPFSPHVGRLLSLRVLLLLLLSAMLLHVLCRRWPLLLLMLTH